MSETKPKVDTSSDTAALETPSAQRDDTLTDPLEDPLQDPLTQGPLPHLGTLQPLFGHHGLGGLQATVGGDPSLDEIDAEAATEGSELRFNAPPDVETAAHEAVHALQQAQSMGPSGDVDGGEGDPLEKSASQLAAKVAQGRSIEAELDALLGGPTQARNARPQGIQRAKRTNTGTTSDKHKKKIARGSAKGLRKHQGNTYAQKKRKERKSREQIVNGVKYQLGSTLLSEAEAILADIRIDTPEDAIDGMLASAEKKYDAAVRRYAKRVPGSQRIASHAGAKWVASRASAVANRHPMDLQVTRKGIRIHIDLPPSASSTGFSGSARSDKLGDLGGFDWNMLPNDFRNKPNGTTPDKVLQDEGYKRIRHARLDYGTHSSLAERKPGQSNAMAMVPSISQKVDDRYTASPNKYADTTFGNKRSSEWLHMVARSDGNGVQFGNDLETKTAQELNGVSNQPFKDNKVQHPKNLVAGSYGANTMMMALEGAKPDNGDRSDFTKDVQAFSKTDPHKADIVRYNLQHSNGGSRSYHINARSGSAAPLAEYYNMKLDAQAFMGLDHSTNLGASTYAQLPPNVMQTLMEKVSNTDMEEAVAAYRRDGTLPT